MPIVKDILGEHFTVERVEPVAEKLLPRFEHAAVFLDASMKVRIPAESIRKADKLRLAVTATTGADHIDLAALEERGVPLLTLKGAEILQQFNGAAELSWLLLLACARKVRSAIHHVERGQWDRTRFPGVMLRGKTIGIIGVGRLGAWMARYAQAFGMKALGHDPYLKEMPEGVESAGLDTLLSRSDAVTIHAHLNDETKGLLDADRLRRMKRGVILVNTSRGEIVDENALAEALKAGIVGAYGADVLGGEPDISANPVWQYAKDHDNIIITPHVGGFCPETVDQAVEFSSKRIMEYFKKT